MKTNYYLATALTLGLLLCGCSNEDDVQMDSIKEIKATLYAFKMEGPQTRTEYNISEQSGFQTVWAAGDVLGIYPIGGDQVSFPISDGVGTTTAKFDGGSWALRGTYKYAAYYPFSTDFYTIDQKAIPVNLVGQVQTGSNTTSHLADYDFMAAAGTQPSSNGSVNLAFNHVGCFLRMQLTMPVAGTFNKVEIATNGGEFTTKGTVNLAATTPALSATETSSYLKLGLNNVKTTNANQTIILYMMVAPDNMSGKTLKFTVTDADGQTYTNTAAGKNMIATYAYNYSLALESTGTGGSTGGGGWDDNNYSNGHEYVDLGLPSGLKWATCNVEANAPEEYGGYYAWGEIEMKDHYSIDNYQYCTYVPAGTMIDDDGFEVTVKESCEYYDLGDNISGTQYDVARQKWGGEWRMPTYSECKELKDNCTMLLCTKDGVCGYKVTGSNGNWIFLPGAGYVNGEYLIYSGTDGYYWSATPYSTIGSAYNLGLVNKDTFWNNGHSSRFRGLSVRPVTD